ncbi:MAG: hypothetical protein NW224_14825 [Leptolyngbyaceae cyanobacterium bins.302]|nr:hypothetical protein [Leptolyngbyaceae cyanobacterium bins.302]
MQSGPGFLPTFLYYFAGTTFIAVFVLAKGLDHPDLALLGNPFQIAIPLGLVAGSLGGYFNGYEQMELPLKNRGADLKKLNQTLTDMGYTETQEVEQVKVYDRAFPSNLFAGKILIQIDDKIINISGRASRIRALRKLFNTIAF